jgi:hypothetical protein
MAVLPRNKPSYASVRSITRLPWCLLSSSTWWRSSWASYMGARRASSRLTSLNSSNVPWTLTVGTKAGSGVAFNAFWTNRPIVSNYEDLSCKIFRRMLWIPFPSLVCSRSSKSPFHCQAKSIGTTLLAFTKNVTSSVRAMFEPMTTTQVLVNSRTRITVPFIQRQSAQTQDDAHGNLECLSSIDLLLYGKIGID